MAIQFRCAGCSQPIEVDNQFAGKTAQCPYCQRIITVPVESTLESNTPTLARPAPGGMSGPPPVPSVPPPLPDYAGGPPMGAGAGWRQPQSDPREASARNFGNFALFFVGLAIALMAAQILLGLPIMTAEMSRLGTTSPTPEQTQEMLQKILIERPYIVVFGWGSAFFGVVGLILGILSWRQWPAANWRAWVSVGACCVFLFCLCGSVMLTVLAGRA